VATNQQAPQPAPPSWLTTFAEILQMLPLILQAVKQVEEVVPPHLIHGAVLHAADLAGVPTHHMALISAIVDRHTQNLVPAALLPPRLQDPAKPAAEPCDHVLTSAYVEDVLRAADAEHPHAG
jgi:hypothetical protein